MGVVRNFIDIIGITPEEELPKENRGQMVVLSDSDSLFVPEDRWQIDTIFQIIIDMEINSSRTLNLPIGRILVLNGSKKFKLIYSSIEKEGQVNIMDFEIPFSTFIELPDGEECGNINVFVLDAYFQLIDSKKIYCNIIYMLDVQHEVNSGAVKKVRTNTISDIREYKLTRAHNIDKQNAKRFNIDEAVISIEDNRNLAIQQINTESACSVRDCEGIFDIDSEYL